MMFCGRASVTDCDEDLEECCQSLPKKSTRRHRNPFSSRGLEKFASVSNELHSRAQKVLSQMGAAQADNIIIRFVYSSSNGWTPVVVRPKKVAAAEGGGAMAKPREDQQKRSLPTSAMKPAKPAKKAAESVEKTNTSNGNGSEGKKGMGLGLGQRLAARFGLRQVDCWPLALVLLLVCLLVFGRLAAVVCTTVWLYFLASFFAADSKQQAVNGRKRNKGWSI